MTNASRVPFGYVVTDDHPYLDPSDPEFERRRCARSDELRAQLLRKCLEDLCAQHAV